MSSRNRTTDTGRRLVGKAAALLPESRPVDAVTPDDCVFAARFTLKSWMGRSGPLARKPEILDSTVASE